MKNSSQEYVRAKDTKIHTECKSFYPILNFSIVSE